MAPIHDTSAETVDEPRGDRRRRSHGTMTARAASMSDVARLAGVSSQTVSRVSNNSDSVTTETRDRVVAAMNELGYRPNSAARALKSGRFHSIGVLMFTLETLGNIRTLDAIAVAAAEKGYSIDLISMLDPSTGTISTALSRLDEEAVDGIIVILETHELMESAIHFPTRIPVVIVDSQLRKDYPSVNADQEQGAALAVRHLLDLGHPTVWHVAGPESSNSASMREASWRNILQAEGRTVPPVLRGTWGADSGYRAGLEIAANRDISAVFTANDQMALGVLRALHEAGRRVPEDVSIVGFDNTEESAEYWPPLTTIHQDFAGAGAQAMSLLFDAIEGREVPSGVRTLSTDLVVRQSTGPYIAR